MSRNLVNPITGSLMPIAGYGQSGNFEGSWDQWNALTETQKAQFRTMDINNDFNGMPIDTDLDPTSEHVIQNKPVAESIEAIVNRCGTKNLMPNTAITQASKGVTYTINSDKSVTMTNTATGGGGIYLSPTQTIKKGTYILSGGTEFIGSGKGVALLATINDQNIILLLNESSEITFTVSQDTTYRPSIWADSGTVLSGETIYPMIRDARISDDTYVPYAMTNTELTKRTTIRYIDVNLKNIAIKLGGDVGNTYYTEMSLAVPAGAHCYSVCFNNAYWTAGVSFILRRLPNGKWTLGIISPVSYTFPNNDRYIRVYYTI